MKKFFQNIKFKKVSLTTLAFALVVSGFLVWGNTEAAITGITVTSPTGGEIWSGTHNITWTTVPVGDGGTVNIYLINGGSSSAIATGEDNDGTYSWNTSAHSDGSSYKIKVASSADSSNIYAESSSTFEIDNTAPTTPSSIHIVSDNTTNTLAKSGDTVTVTATVDAGTTVTGTIGGKPTTTNVVSGTTATITRLLDGSETGGAGLDFTLISTDVAGNNATTVTETDITDGSAVKTDFSVTANFGSATDNVGSVTGTLTSGDTTDDTSLVLAGTNEASSTVAVYDGATLLGSATINGTSWSYEATVADGTTYQFNVIETDAAGNVSSATANFTVIGDMSVTANFTSATDDAGSVKGTLTSGDTTDDTSLSLAGTNEADSTVAVYNGETLLGSATVTGTGWTYEATVADGITYQFNVIETDAAGNVSSATADFTVIGDTTAPTTPTTVHIESNNTTTTLAKAGDTVTVTATVDSGTTVSGTIGGQTATGSVDGTTATLSRVLTGEEIEGAGLDFQLISTDAAGNATTVTKTNIGDSSAVQTDFTPPTTPTTVHIESNNTTTTLAKAGDTVTVTATVDSGTTVSGTIGGQTATGSVDGTTATLSRVLTGEEIGGAGLDFVLISTDAAGNDATTVTKADIGDSSAVRTDFSVTANFTSATDGVGSVTGTLTSGDTTDDTSLSLAGTNEAGSTVAVYNGETLLGSATVTGTGWTYEATVADGITYQFNVIETDAAGNVSSATADFTVIGDTTAPTGYSITLDQDYANSSNKTAISFTFASAEEGATYNYSIDDVDNPGTLAVTGTDAISSAADQITDIDVSGLADGTLTITVTLTDAAGNAGTGVTDTIVKDTVAPTVTNTYIATTGNNGTGGGFKNGDIINVSWNNSDAGDNNANIASVTVDFSEFGGEATVVATNTGNIWSATYTLPADVNLTGKKVLVTATDTAGNPTTTAGGNTYNVDTKKPTVAIDSVTANPTNGDIAVTVEFSEPTTDFIIGDVSVTGGVPKDFVATDGDSYTFNVDPTDGASVAVSISIDAGVATDAAGNTNIASNVLSYTSDTVAPVLPVDGIVGTTILGAGDQIILTFSEAVSPKDGVWSADEFTSIGDPGAFDLSGASFDATTTGEGYTQLTITLGEDPEDEDTYLWNGNYLTVDPANGAIVDAAGNELSDSAVTGTTAVTGDTVAPTVALTYSPDRSLLGLESVMITATFNELMDETTAPRIAIDTQGDGDLVASASTAMTKTAPTVWTFDWQVPGGHDDVGIATVSVTGTDLAGNANATASNNTRVITSPDSIITGFTAGSITTTGATLTVTTSENATCKYATEAATFANMTQMGTTGGTTHTQALTGLTEGTKYTNYRVRCSISSNAVSDLEYVEFTTNSVAGTGSFGVVSKTMTKMTGTADNTYGNGWEWIVRITLPTDRNEFALKFSDWVSGSNTMAAGENMRYYSEQIASGTGSSASPITITDDNTYPDAVTVVTDVDPTLDGIQTNIHVQVKIPTTTPAGSYSTSFQVFYDEPEEP